jgi:kynurenine/2-aminoadipate aminotransferase
MREILRERKMSGEKMPKIMYINPTGTNPTGIIIPLERRKEIYRIACEYNFLILDDDPYHFIHFDKVSYLCPENTFNCCRYQIQR